MIDICLQFQRDRSNTTTLEAIQKLGRKGTIYTCDLSSQEDVTALTPTVLADGHKIHILVNCAGIQRRHPSAEFPDNDWSEVCLHFLITPLLQLTHFTSLHFVRHTDRHFFQTGNPSKPNNSIHPLSLHRVPHALPPRSIHLIHDRPSRQHNQLRLPPLLPGRLTVPAYAASKAP